MDKVEISNLKRTTKSVRVKILKLWINVPNKDFN